MCGFYELLHDVSGVFRSQSPNSGYLYMFKLDLIMISKRYFIAGLTGQWGCGRLHFCVKDRSGQLVGENSRIFRTQG